MPAMFEAVTETIEAGRAIRYSLHCGAECLSFADVLNLWQTDGDFRSFYTQLLADASFGAYRWETPALTRATAIEPFEFVLLNAPHFGERKTDPITYKGYFVNDDEQSGIVSFANLSGDATLIVPSPRTTTAAYGHLAAFVRQAPSTQQHALWQVVGATVMARLGDEAIWLSTAGGGVAWLHVRIDSRPKYYSYRPYAETRQAR